MNGAKTQLLSARFQGCFQASQVSRIGYRQKTIVLDGTLEMVIGLVMGVPERKLDFVVAWLRKLARLVSRRAACNFGQWRFELMGGQFAGLQAGFFPPPPL